jgi:hypothetical protein
MRAASASSVEPSLNADELHPRQRLVGWVHDERTERAHHVHHARRQSVQERRRVFADAFDAQDAG